METYRVTCSYCLGAYLTVGQDAHIARHGFTVQGQRPGQGLVGCWHTGPCDGYSYPHLGISKRGTEVALSRIQGALAMHRETLAKLQTRPVLGHTEVEYQRDTQTGRRLQSKSQEWDVKDGDPELQYHYGAEVWTRGGKQVKLPKPEVNNGYYALTIPSYEQLWRGKVDEVETVINRLEAEERRYQKVIQTWTPEKYAPNVVLVSKKVPLVHMRSSHGFGVLCVRMYSVSGPERKATTNPAEVTCTRCKAHMERYAPKSA